MHIMRSRFGTLRCLAISVICESIHKTVSANSVGRQLRKPTLSCNYLSYNGPTSLHQINICRFSSMYNFFCFSGTNRSENMNIEQTKIASDS